MKKNRMKYFRYLVTIFIVLLFLILGYFIIQKVFIKTNYHAPIYKMQTVSLYGKSLLESKLGIKLPEGTIIKYLDIEGWHEIDLFTLLQVPNNSIEAFVNGISVTREPINSIDLKKDVDWWQIKKEDCDLKLHQSSPPTEYIISKPRNRYAWIYIKSWINLSDEEWKLFSRE